MENKNNYIASTTKEEAFKRRIHSFVWSAIAAIACIVIGIVLMNKNNPDGIICIVGSVFVFTFISNLILFNNFIPEWWVGIAKTGIRLPGIIFEFSLDGFIFLVVIKILFWIIGVIISILMGILATVICLILSPFVYPVALVRNFKGIVD